MNLELALLTGRSGEDAADPDGADLEQAQRHNRLSREVPENAKNVRQEQEFAQEPHAKTSLKQASRTLGMRSSLGGEEDHKADATEDEAADHRRRAPGVLIAAAQQAKRRARREEKCVIRKSIRKQFGRQFTAKQRGNNARKQRRTPPIAV